MQPFFEDTANSLDGPPEAFLAPTFSVYENALPSGPFSPDEEDTTGFREPEESGDNQGTSTLTTDQGQKSKGTLGSDSPPLSSQEARVLDSMVNQAMLSASIEDGLTLPWETGVMAAIFGDEPLVSLPKQTKVAHSLQAGPSFGPDKHSDCPGQPSKRLKTSETTQRRYERAIVFKNSLTDRELDDAKWNRALEKLYAIMVSCQEGTPQGVRFDEKDIELNLRQIKILCGARSPNTVAKRANSLARYCVWHKGYFYRKHPIPFSPDDISDYIWEKHQDGVAYGTLAGFIEAVNFATFVLGLPVKDANTPLVSAFTKGILDKAATRRPERKQARPLKVSEVQHLEGLLGNDKIDLYDRYAAGAFLFAIYARCRWSDLRRVHGFDLDVALSNGKLVGFLGFSTFSHKTASQVAKHGHLVW